MNSDMWRLTFLLFVSALCGQTAPDLDAVIGEVRREFQSEQAMDYMRKVYANDRYFTFPRFQATAEYLKQQMQQIGLRGVEIVDAPADGVTQFGYWTAPLA